jgi:integrase/recombinase XerD
MASVNLFFDDRSQRKDGTYPIKLLVNYCGERRMISIKQFATKETWNELPTSAKKELKSKWRYLNGLLTKGEDLIKELGRGFTWGKFKTKILAEGDVQTKQDELLLTELFDEKIKKFIKNNQFRSAINFYQPSISSLLKFKGSLTLYDITVDLLNQYERWLSKKGISDTTIGNYIRPIRTIYNEAPFTELEF